MHTVMHRLHAMAAQTLVPATTGGGIDNPMDQVTPTMDFGDALNNKWLLILGVVWGIAIIWRIVQLVISVGTFRAAKENPMAQVQSKNAVIWDFVFLVAIVAIPAIVGFAIYLGT